MKSRKVVIRNAREFYNFCKVQFIHTAYDPSKSNQNFIQEFFFVEDIPRDDSEVVAVTTEHTHSYYSIHSTGQFCVVEMRQVSCCCESCLLEMGKTVPIRHMHQSGKQSIFTLVKLLLKKISGICIGI